MSTLGEVAEVVSGGTPRTSNPAFWSGDVVWVTPTEIVANNGKTIFSSARTITEAGLSSSSAKLLPVDTVLVTSRATIGAVALAGIPLATNQGFASLICKEDVLPKFVMYWCQDNKQQFIARAGGNTFLEISRKKVAQIPILVPPVTEQRRIVDLVGSIDRYIDSLQTQVEATRAARSAVLSDYFSNPGDDWQETSLKEVASIVKKRVDPTSLGDEIYVGLEHLVSNRRELLMWGSTSDVSSSTTPFLPGDTLFGRLRPYLQKGCVAPVAGFCSPEVLVLRPATGMFPQFLGLLVLRDAVFEECNRLSAGSRMPRTSAKDLMGLSVLVPPLAEQRRIADLIGSIDEQVAALEFQTASAQVIRSGVLSELLSGERLLDDSYDVKVSL